MVEKVSTDERICVGRKYSHPLDSRQYFDVDKVPRSILNCRIVKGYKQVIMMKVLLFDMKEVPRRRVWMIYAVVLDYKCLRRMENFKRLLESSP